MGNFKDVFLGVTDSDTEAKRYPKKFNDSFFDPDDNINELLYGYKFVVGGRKGDGKTAYSARIHLLEDELDICTAQAEHPGNLCWIIQKSVVFLYISLH